MGCHFLLQGIFLNQGSNPGLLHCRHILYQLSYQRSLIHINTPIRNKKFFKRENRNPESVAGCLFIEAGLTSKMMISNLKSESKIAQSCPILCDPMDCSPPGSSIHGIFQVRVWSGLPFPSPGDLPDPRIEPRSPALQADALTSEPLMFPKAQIGRAHV